MRGWADPRAALQSILDERATLYGQADVALNTDDLGIAGVLDAITSG
jgi:hypothetical protein